MSTFGLVHGAWHGAWCWERLIPELEARGHRAIAMDLPIEDASAGTARRAATVVDALAGADDDVIVVGHSAAGVTIPLVAAARPVRRLVFLCAQLREPGHTTAELAGTITTRPAVDMSAGMLTREDGATVWTNEEVAIAAFYHDCSPADARWAFSRLRPQYSTMQGINPLAAWPATEYRAIYCVDDRVVSPDVPRLIVPRVLGVTPVELPGGHSPFLSRPSALADLLTEGLAR
jgi:pimeloyl-ACP methyl ester carboxylesterase